MLAIISELLLPMSMSAVMMLLNSLAFLIRLVLHRGKAQVNPRCLAVVITGCDSGFGEMSAVKLNKLGFQVIATCLTQEGADRIKENVTVAFVCDITKEEDVQKLFEVTEKKVNSMNGHLWALINNAGIATSGPLDWIKLNDYRSIMEVNFFGHVSVIKTMLPLLKQCGESRVINLSSVAGLLGGANLSAYSASKHAMEGLMKSLVAELRPWHIYVSNINPAFMRTPMVTSNSVEKGMKVFNEAPDDVRSQYSDPRPQLTEGQRLIGSSSEDPTLVVDSIVDAVTDAHPEMWYFPGKAASILRYFTLATSDSSTYFLSKVSEGTVHTPSPEILNKRKPKRL